MGARYFKIEDFKVYIGKGPVLEFVGILLIARLISSPRNCEDNI
jgi:hypothetical protein